MRFQTSPYFSLLLLLLLLLDLPYTPGACNGKYTDFCDDFETDEAEARETAMAEKLKRMNATRFRRSPLANGIGGNPFRKEKALSTQISTILDTLFNNGYDRQIRPQLGKEPLEVEVNIAIRSMGPVDEMNQVFSLDCYFRQYWTDTRLRYNATRLTELPMNWQFLNKIWRPDTYIINGKNSYLHKMTVPNRFIRIAPDGRISYSQRLTVKARCQMDLHNFPLDRQLCPLGIGSFGHSARDIVYKWSEKPLSMEQLGLAQYELSNWTHVAYQEFSKSINQNVSAISLHFEFQRQTGFYLLQIYIPMTLIVMCSWVTFWLSKTEKGSEIPARTSLGASSVLSVVTIGFGGKSKPQVGYATALDIFIILCFVNVFAALVEFAFLNFLDTLVRRLKRKDAESKLVLLMAQHGVMGRGRMPKIPERQESCMDTDGIGCDDDVASQSESSTPTYRGPGVYFNGERVYMEDVLEDDRDCSARCLDACLNCLSYLNCCRPIRQMEIYVKPHVVFNRVDRCSRKLFPFTFLLLNLIYWYGYMYLF